MSLRKLPPEQNVSPRRWRRLRYVPLIVLAILALVSAVTGGFVANRQSAEAAHAAVGAPIGPKAGTVEKTAEALPSLCHPAVPPPPQQPWLGDATEKAKADAMWTAHESDLKQPYVLEKDGWADWGDIQAANFSQAVGRRNLSNAEAERWHDHFAQLRDSLAAMNIPLYIVITPAKWDVYPQELPDWAQNIRGSGPLDQLLANYPDLPIVDLRAPLRAASQENQTYSKTNSHWTDYGAYIGWQATTACMDATSPALSGLSVPPIDGVSISADRNEFSPFGIPDPPPNWTSPDYSMPPKEVTVIDGKGTTSTNDGTVVTDLLSLPAETTTTDAQTDHTALFVRDSFGNALSVPLQQSFAKTWQVRHNLDSAPDTRPDIHALAREHHPDVVILQIAQRYLNFVP